MSDIKTVLESAKNQMEKTIAHLELELAKVRAGKANPAMLDNVMVDYYGSKVTLSNTASVNTQDSRTILVQPWEKAMLTPIEKACIICNTSDAYISEINNLFDQPFTVIDRENRKQATASMANDAKTKTLMGLIQSNT